MNHAQILSGGFTPGAFGFSICDRDSETLDELLVGGASGDIASRLASMVGISSYLVECSASGNVITVSFETGVDGPVTVSTNSGSAPATLSRFVPGVYTAQVSSSARGI
jgi:hypothetical protein